MAEQEYLYVGGMPVAEVTGLLAGALGLRIVDGDEPGSFAMVGPAADEGATTEAWVEPNEPAFDPADATAGYAVEVAVHVRGTQDAQRAEAYRMFESLFDARPDVPVLVTHEGVYALAAYLPGKGVHEFPAGTEAGPEQADAWRGWVPASRT